MPEIRINDIPLQVETGTTILQAARKIGIRIPSLCDHPGLLPDGNCRLCMVEITQRGRSSLVASCMFPINIDGISVRTETPRIERARRFILGLLMDRCPESKPLRELAEEYGATPFGRLPETDPSDLCINCGRCVRACAEEGAACLDFAWRGWERKIGPAFGEPPQDCIGCASCASCCPTGAIELTEDKDTRTIWGKRFELVHCKVCGKPIGTREQLRALGGNSPDDQLCDRCRKRSFASQFLPRNKRS